MCYYVTIFWKNGTNRIAHNVLFLQFGIRVYSQSRHVEHKRGRRTAVPCAEIRRPVTASPQAWHFSDTGLRYGMGMTERFREAITIMTDWPAGAAAGDETAEMPLVRFQEFLVREYPLFHKNTERRTPGPYAVIYRWPGRRPRGKPLLFLAHYDVVPAEAGNWDAGPFDAELRDGYIYGRGTLDMKGILIALMEAAEALCARGFRPEEDIWVAFGGDEERAGFLGAGRSAVLFEEQGIHFDWILDEGPAIGEGQIKGVKGPVAFFGIEEKGFLSLDLTVRQRPGHASRPPRIQAAVVLARALIRLSKRPFPRRLTPTVESFLARLAPLVPGFRGRVFKHSRFLGPLFFPICEKDPMFKACSGLPLL